MTGEEVKREGLGRVRVPEKFQVRAWESADKWLLVFPDWYVFGPRDVLALERLLKRELVMLEREEAL